MPCFPIDISRRRRLYARLPVPGGDSSLSGARVACEPDRLIASEGKPAMVVSDKRERVHVAGDPPLEGNALAICRLPQPWVIL